MNTFVQAYIECALWSSTDDDGVSLDESKYADLMIAPETLIRFASDCERFQKDCEQFDLSDFSDRQVAHDFWLTRNRCCVQGCAAL